MRNLFYISKYYMQREMGMMQKLGKIRMEIL